MPDETSETSKGPGFEPIRIVVNLAAVVLAVGIVVLVVATIF